MRRLPEAAVTRPANRDRGRSRRFAVRVMTSDARESLALLKAPACLKPDRRKADASRVLDLRHRRDEILVRRPVTWRAQRYGSVAFDVALRRRRSMRLALAVTGLAMHAGLFAHRLVTSETTLRIHVRLDNAERILERRLRFRIVTRREAEAIAFAIPGDAMLHPSTIPFDHRRDRLDAGAERPRDRRVQSVRVLRERNNRARVTVIHSRPLPQLPAVEVLAVVCLQCVCVRSGGLVSNALGVASRAISRTTRSETRRGYCDSENKSRCRETSCSESCFARANACAASGLRPSD